MKKRKLIISMAIFLSMYFGSCNFSTPSDSNTIASDTATISRGEVSFIQHCSGCHNFRQDGIGPQLGGLTASVSADWIQLFIRNPKKSMESGNERGMQLLKKYKLVMPSFTDLSDDEINGIIAFLNTHKKVYHRVTKDNGRALSNPIPDSVCLSNLVVDLKQVVQIPASSDSGELPLTRITKLDFAPPGGNLFILDLRGKLYQMQNYKAAVYMDMATLRPKFINQPGLATGFGSFAFHPGFATNGLLYTTHTEPAGKADFSYADSIKVTLQWVLTEWKTEKPGSPTFSGKGRELFRVNMVSGIHGVQEIAFNPLAKAGDDDYGMLYIGIGDGGSVEEGYPFLAHRKDRVWGTILRIDPRGKSSANGQYGIPQSNPFANSKNSKTLGEVYAYGFRNPHRIAWSKAGQMLVCNIGHGNIESVNMIQPGHDYGWPIREGTFLLNPYGDMNKVYPLPPDDSMYHINYPVAQYDHGEVQGKAISGGFEYTGASIPALAGKYLFGDIPTGKLLYIDMADVMQGKQAPIREWRVSVNGTQKTLEALCGSERVDLHFGRDGKGELYILTKADGKVYKLVSAGER